jgi:hypothetical protein
MALFELYDCAPFCFLKCGIDRIDIRFRRNVQGNHPIGRYVNHFSLSASAHSHSASPPDASFGGSGTLILTIREEIAFSSGAELNINRLPEGLAQRPWAHAQSLQAASGRAIRDPAPLFPVLNRIPGKSEPRGEFFLTEFHASAHLSDVVGLRNVNPHARNVLAIRKINGLFHCMNESVAERLSCFLS